MDLNDSDVMADTSELSALIDDILSKKVRDLSFQKPDGKKQRTASAIPSQLAAEALATSTPVGNGPVSRRREVLKPVADNVPPKQKISEMFAWEDDDGDVKETEKKVVSDAFRDTRENLVEKPEAVELDVTEEDSFDRMCK